jgi:hypothetical protein
MQTKYSNLYKISKHTRSMISIKKYDNWLYSLIIVMSLYIWISHTEQKDWDIIPCDKNEMRFNFRKDASDNNICQTYIHIVVNIAKLTITKSKQNHMTLYCTKTKVNHNRDMIINYDAYMAFFSGQTGTFRAHLCDPHFLLC